MNFVSKFIEQRIAEDPLPECKWYPKQQQQNNPMKMATINFKQWRKGEKKNSFQSGNGKCFEIKFKHFNNNSFYRY